MTFTFGFKGACRCSCCCSCFSISVSFSCFCFLAFADAVSFSLFFALFVFTRLVRGTLVQSRVLSFVRVVVVRGSRTFTSFRRLRVCHRGIQILLALFSVAFTRRFLLFFSFFFVAAWVLFVLVVVLFLPSFPCCRVRLATAFRRRLILLIGDYGVGVFLRLLGLLFGRGGGGV